MIGRKAIAFALFALMACGRASTPPEAPKATSEAEVQRAIVPAPVPVSPGIAVSEDIARRCRLDVGNVERAPKFAFDRSELRPEDYEVLDKVARCVIEGHLGYASLGLVGRADPRGSHEYNLALGARRARSVGDVLRERGVDPNLIHEISRGELDAVGTDETTWATDRRVDIIRFRPLGEEE